MSTPLIAVVMACHNRRASTVSCLQHLQQQVDIKARLELFVTDDGSMDGTAEAIRIVWPEATIIRGDGSLYWAAGMVLAERSAVARRPDFLLWLNDDTILVRDAIARLLAQSEASPGAIIPGTVADPESGEVTYGGRKRVDRHPQRFALLPAAEMPQRADTFNGNVVLIPWAARQRVGPIDGLFPHAYADDDYGLRATALGVPVVQAPGIVGQCPRHGTNLRLAGSPAARWRQLQAPNAVPWRAQGRFLRRHGDWRWPLLLVHGQIRRVLTGRM